MKYNVKIDCQETDKSNLNVNVEEALGQARAAMVQGLAVAIIPVKEDSSGIQS